MDFDFPQPFWFEHTDAGRCLQHLCRGESCLGELQLQLAIVFVGKTTGKQIGYTLKPLAFKYVQKILAHRAMNSILKSARGGLGMVPGAAHLMERFEAVSFQDAVSMMEENKASGMAPVEEQSQVRLTRDGGTTPVHGHSVSSMLTLPGVLQLMPYEGTFDE